MKKIIVAGGGLGGLVAGALLAKQGLRVDVFARGTEKDHGYDWTDCMNIQKLGELIGRTLSADEYGKMSDVTYHNPADTAPITFSFGKNPPLWIERKHLSELLLSFAKECGVHFHWNTAVTGAQTAGGRVTGIKTDKGNHSSDLVIDACGFHSAVRESLPENCMVEQKPGNGSAFHVWRGLFRREAKGPIGAFPYEIYMMHQNEPGISWCVTTENEMDLLIGRFFELDDAKVASACSDLREKKPEISNDLLRGGCYSMIPVRRPLVKPVADGYAAVGDSAYMTFPLIGSGIDLAMEAGELLAETVLADRDGLYTTETLWPYHYTYIRRHGKELADIDRLKNTLLNLKPSDIDFLFEKKLFTAEDLAGAGSGKGVSPLDLLFRVLRGAGRLPVLLKVAGCVTRGEKLTSAYNNIPAVYTPAAFECWRREIESSIVPLKT